MEHASCSQDEIMEWWNVGLNKVIIHFIASLSKGILPIESYPIFQNPLFPGPDLTGRIYMM
jgi:hypothetical protein